MRTHGKVPIGASHMVNVPFIEGVLISVITEYYQAGNEKFSDLPFHSFLFNLIYRLFYPSYLFKFSAQMSFIIYTSNNKLQNDQTIV